MQTDTLFHSETYQLNEAYINTPFLLQIALEKLKVGTNVVLKNIFFNTQRICAAACLGNRTEYIIELTKEQR